MKNGIWTDSARHNAEKYGREKAIYIHIDDIK